MICTNELNDILGQKIAPTQNVVLLESPFGNWEVDAVDVTTGTIYLVDGPGTIFCNANQVRIIKK